MADPNSLEAPAEYIDPAGMRDDEETPREAPAQFAGAPSRDREVAERPESVGASLPALDVDAELEEVLTVVKQRSAALLRQLQAQVEQRPRLFVGLGVGLTVIALLAGVYGLKNRKPRWRRELEAYRQALAEGVQFRIRIPNES